MSRAERIALDTPVGRLVIVGNERAVTAIGWSVTRSASVSAKSSVAQAARQLEDYFAGRRTLFEVSVAPIGTAFQQRVWSALREIPYAEVVSYGDIAKRVDSAPRAVGMACGANPIPILIPCHRVVAADGKLTGYSAGAGIATKRALLAHEQGSDLFAAAGACYDGRPAGGGGVPTRTERMPIR